MDAKNTTERRDPYTNARGARTTKGKKTLAKQKNNHTKKTKVCSTTKKKHRPQKTKEFPRELN